MMQSMDPNSPPGTPADCKEEFLPSAFVDHVTLMYRCDYCSEFMCAGPSNSASPRAYSQLHCHSRDIPSYVAPGMHLRCPPPSRCLLLMSGSSHIAHFVQSTSSHQLNIDSTQFFLFFMQASSLFLPSLVGTS